MKPSLFTITEKALEPELPFGCTAVCCPRSKPRSGDFIVYLTGAAGAPIFRRYIEMENGTILLQASNPAFSSFTTTPDQFRTRGKAFVILSINRTFRESDLPLEPVATEKNPFEESYLTFAEAQQLLKVRRTRMYELLHSGVLQAKKMGRLWRVPRSAVEHCLSSGLGIIKKKKE